MTGKVNFQELACHGGSNKIGVAELDNPGSLNALTLGMLKQLKSQLELWEQDENIVCVFLHGAGEKAFCAGGDVRTMYHWMKSWSDAGEAENSAEQFLTEYFSVEYSCDYLIHSYRKPIIVWGEGIVMGGGIGLYVGASHRVTTPGSRLAMPEISIGLYPDVGGTWFLNQLPPGIGLFLGLTGAPLNASDALDLAMAEQILMPEDKPRLLEALQGLAWQDAMQHHAQISALLGEFATHADIHHPASQLIPYFAQIQTACLNPDLVEVCRQIQAIDGFGRWIEQAKKTLQEGSPITAHLCFRQVTEYQQLSLADCFRLELSLSVRCGLLGEFQEGVRARLIDKTGQPNWRYPSIQAVDSAVIDTLFTSLWSEQDHPLALLGREPRG